MVDETAYEIRYIVGKLDKHTPMSKVIHGFSPAEAKRRAAQWGKGKPGFKILWIKRAY